MKTSPSIPFPDLPLKIVDDSAFNRVDIAQMFGVHPSLITKDCQALNLIEKGKVEGFTKIEYYLKIDRDNVWLIYAIECFRRFYWMQGTTPHRPRFAKEINDCGASVIDEYVKKAGGSRQHFERLLETFETKRKISKLRDHVIDVQAS